MAHTLIHDSKTMKRSDSRKSHSWWWDSHTTPKNSKWLTDNLEEMDQSVKQMLKMIEEDADSFAKKAEMYYQKRPVLISHVEEFYRLYRSLAERYDYLTGELRKNGSSELQSQSSGFSDISEPSSAITFSDQMVGRRRSSNRAAGFDFFLGSGGISTEIDQKEGDGSSSLTDFGTESDDDSSVKNYADQRLSKNTTELELEESADSEDLVAKIARYEEELRIAREKMRNSSAETAKLKTDMDGKFKEVAEDLEITKQKVRDSEIEISRLKLQIKEHKSSGETQNSPMKREVSKLHERITRLKTSLSDRDHEIRDLKTAVSDAEQKIFPEKAQVKEEIRRLSEEVNDLKEQIRDWECRGRSSEEEIRKAKREKVEDEERLKIKILKLETELAGKNESMKKLEQSIHESNSETKKLQTEMDEIRETTAELRRRTAEMAEEIAKQREAIIAASEEKREVIRQLCFSIEHHREDNHRLRRAFKAHKNGRR